MTAFYQQLSASPAFTWVILPVLIFLARICDVSFGTLRIIFISRGKKFIAPILGFCEVSIWLLAMSQIMQNLDNVVCFLAYAGGYATGNFVGILIEDKLALGMLIVRVFLVKDETGMKKRLYDAGFGVTVLDGHGRNGNVEILYTVIKRKDLDQVVSIIEECQSKAFYSVEDARSVRQGIFPQKQKIRKWHYRKIGK